MRYENLDNIISKLFLELIFWKDEVIIKRRLAKIEWPEIDNEEYLQSIILP